MFTRSFRLAEMFEWPPEWLNPPSTGESNAAAWLQRIEEYAAGQSDRVAHIPDFGRLEQGSGHGSAGVVTDDRRGFFGTSAMLEAENGLDMSG